MGVQTRAAEDTGEGLNKQIIHKKISKQTKCTT